MIKNTVCDICGEAATFSQVPVDLHNYDMCDKCHFEFVALTLSWRDEKLKTKKQIVHDEREI